MLLPLQGDILTPFYPRVLPWARCYCPFRAYRTFQSYRSNSFEAYLRFKRGSVKVYVRLNWEASEALLKICGSFENKSDELIFTKTNCGGSSCKVRWWMVGEGWWRVGEGLAPPFTSGITCVYRRFRHKGEGWRVKRKILSLCTIELQRWLSALKGHREGGVQACWRQFGLSPLCAWWKRNYHRKCSGREKV